MNTTRFTPALMRVLELAEIEASKDGLHVSAYHVLVAMLLEDKNSGGSFLKTAGFTVEGLRKHQGPAPEPLLEISGHFSEEEQNKLKEQGFVRVS